LTTTDDTTNSHNGEKMMYDFEALKTEEKNQSVKDYTEYQELLRSIAQNKCTLSKSEVLRIIERANADVTQLQTDVEWRCKRDEMIAELKRVPEYRTQRDELTATLQKLADEFKKVKEEYVAKSDPLYWKRDQFCNKINKAEDCRRTLFESCRDTNLKVEYETLQQQWDNHIEKNLYNRQEGIQSELSDARYQYKYYDNNFTVDRDEQKRYYKERIKSLEAEYDAIELKKSEIATKKAQHEAALEQLREQMIFA
jgi:hypothetical protein